MSRQMVPSGKICEAFGVAHHTVHEWGDNFPPLGRGLHTQPNPRYPGAKLYDLNEALSAFYEAKDSLVIDGRRFTWIERAAKDRKTTRASLYYHFVLHPTSYGRNKNDRANGSPDKKPDVRKVWVWDKDAKTRKRRRTRRGVERIYVADDALRKFDRKQKKSRRFLLWPTACEVEEDETLGFDQRLLPKWTKSCRWLGPKKKLKGSGPIIIVDDRGRFMQTEKFNPAQLRKIKNKMEACPGEGVFNDEVDGRKRTWLVRSKINDTWPNVPVGSLPGWYDGLYAAPVELPKRRYEEVLCGGTLRKCPVYLSDDPKLPCLRTLDEAFGTDVAAVEQRRLRRHTVTSGNRTLISYSEVHRKVGGSITKRRNLPLTELGGKVFYAERVQFPSAGNRHKLNRKKKWDGKQWGYDLGVVNEYAAWQVAHPGRIGHRGPDGRILKTPRVNANGHAGANGETANDAARPQLSEKMKLALQAMLELKVLDRDRRRTRDEIVEHAEPDVGNSDSYKMTFAEMVRLRFIDRKIGRDGGYWLLASGKAEATSIQKG